MEKEQFIKKIARYLMKVPYFGISLFIIAIVIISFTVPVYVRAFIEIVAKSGESLYLYKDYHALVVGVSDYDKWPDLPNAVKDAQEVSEALKRLGFTVKLMSNPTSKELKKGLNDLTYKYGREENRALLFYYAGHGETELLADDTKLGYIIPSDCPLLCDDPQGFVNRAISMKDIEVYSLRIHSKHVLMLFDSCFSGSLFSLVRAVPEDITEKSSLPVRQYITAGTEDETVPDRSMFKRCLLLGLEGDADLTRDGYITGTELGLYLSDKVVQGTGRAQHPQYGKIRTPELARGDFIFALKRPSKPMVPTAVTPLPPPRPGGISDYDAIIEEREANERRWADWQSRMEADFARAQKYDQSKRLKPEEKVKVWSEFLSPYRAENTYTTKDDELREKAEKRRRHWKEFKAAFAKHPSKPDTSLLTADIPDELLIKSDGFKTHKKGSVKLSHKKHNIDYKVACTERHHVYEEDKNVYKDGDPVQRCSGCHDVKKSEGKVKKLMLAYHRNCQGCHKGLKTASKQAGPTMKCNNCHEKKK